MLFSDKPLAGRTAIVTGSGRNIGRAMVRMFAKAGASVVVNGHRDKDAVDRVVGEIEAEGGRAIGIMADVGSPSDVNRMVAEAITAFGKVDIAISNVGVRVVQDFLKITPEDWNRVLNANLNSAFYMAQACLPGMIERKWGRLIHVSGDDGFNAMNYTRAHNIVAKAGVHTLARVLSNAYCKHGVTINTLGIGRTDTERDWANLPKDYKEQAVSHVPMGRFAQPDEMAAAALFLACDTGAFITGAALHINGGETTYAT